MEWFFLKVIPKEYEELPGTILTNLLVREFEKGDGSWYESNMTQYKEGGKWRLGEIVKERTDTVRITPIEVRMKLHKTPIGYVCGHGYQVIRAKLHSD